MSWVASLEAPPALFSRSVLLLGLGVGLCRESGMKPASAMTMKLPAVKT